MVLAHRVVARNIGVNKWEAFSAAWHSVWAMGALAGITLLPDQDFLSPTADTPSATSTSLGSFQKTLGLLPSPHPELFSAETPLGFFWLPTVCPVLSFQGFVLVFLMLVENGFLLSCISLSKWAS